MSEMAINVNNYWEHGIKRFLSFQSSEKINKFNTLLLTHSIALSIAIEQQTFGNWRNSITQLVLNLRNFDRN